jgi:hypothetical protein
MMDLRFIKLLISYCCLTGVILIPGKIKASSFSQPVNHIDSAGPSKNLYKLSQTEFLNHYGTDDSSRALINLFFNKRHIGRKFLFVPLVLLGSYSIAFGIFLLTSKSMGIGTAIVWGSYLGVVAGLTLVFSLIGGLKLKRYSRKNLYRLLNKYHAGMSIPVNIRTKPAFNKQLMNIKP